MNSEQKLKKYFFPPQWVNDTRHGEGELTWVTGRFLRKYWPFSKLMSSGYIQLFLIIKFQTIFCLKNVKWEANSFERVLKPLLNFISLEVGWPSGLKVLSRATLETSSTPEENL